MKKLCILAALVLALSLMLVSCRNYDADDGMYGYYNQRDTDREYKTRSVTDDAKNRIMDSYDSAKSKVKNAIDSTAEYIGDAISTK